MPKRTPEEIQAQREAWLARKAARAAGQDVPSQSPASSGEALAVSVDVAPPEPEAPPPPPTQPEVVVQPTPEPAPAAPHIAPQAPATKRTPEELRAQREAFLAAKAARAAGAAAPAPKPALAPAPPPAAKPVAEAAPPAPKPGQAEVAPRPTPAKAQPAEEKADSHITRREFLNYAWLASIALFSLETVALSLWFAFPIFKPGQFGGEFPIGDAASALTEVNALPKPYTDGKFWLVNLDTQAANGEPRKGIMAIYKVCTHLGCLYDWQTVTSRFECPCHGSKFTLAGDYIAGPARRSLDRFVIKAIGADGTVVAQTNEQGNPLELPSEDVQLIVDTGQRILGVQVVTPA